LGVAAHSTLLLFDIDGTMLSCQGRGLRAMHRAVQRVFGRPPSNAEIRAGGKTDPMLFEELAGAYGLAPGELDAGMSTLHHVYAAEFAVELRDTGACAVKPGIEALLAALAARPDTRLGLVTGNLEPTARLKLDSVRLGGFFRAGGFGSDGRRRADLVGLAIERCGFGTKFDPRRIWVIGDTPADVEGGRAHGVRTLAVATGTAARHELEACAADALFDDFTDTDHVVRTLCHAD
jgi:phosphoglycolate phosphatase-like HAD superfamily hydrolase